MGATLLLSLCLLTRPGFQSVRIIGTGDLCCRVLPSPDFSAPGLPRRELGGWENLAQLISELRTDATLLLDCGGFAFGSYEGRTTQGRAAVRLMNLCRYDAATLGARDFAGGADNIEILAKTANFPILADPMLDVALNRRVPMFRPFVLKDIRGVKVAVIGISDPEVQEVNRRVDTKGFAPGEPVAQARRYLAVVKAEAPDVIVALGHISSDKGAVLLDSFPEIDLVICPPRRAETGDAPEGVVRTGRFGQSVVTIDILYDRVQKDVYKVEARTWNVLPGKSDSAAWSLVEGVKVAEMDAPVCFAPAEIPIEEMAGLVAEAVRTGAGADVAILPWSAISSGLAEGRLTKRAVFDAVPFSEPARLVLMDDTTLHRFVAGLEQSGPFPMLAGADLFVMGDTLGRPVVSQVARLRMKERKSTYRFATTEQMLERAGFGSAGRLIEKNLSDLWLDWALSHETLKAVPGPKLYRASAGLAVRPDTVSFPININTATQALLEKLPGVGPKTAQRIIEYRNQHGRFRAIDDLINVKGIGPKTLEKMRPLATVR